MITVTDIIYQGGGMTISFSDGSLATAIQQVVNGQITLIGLSPEQLAALDVFNDAQMTADNPDVRFRTNLIGPTGPTGPSAENAWTQTTAFNTTPPTSSTITMTADLSAIIKVGSPIKYKQGGVYYYALATVITSGQLSIAGAPLNTGAASLQELWYATPGSIGGHAQVMEFFIGGRFGDAADSALLQNDAKVFFEWPISKAFLVRFSVRVGVQDSGASQPRVNVDINGLAVSTSNGNAGLDVAAGSWTRTVVDIDTSKYTIQNGQALELMVDNNGSNKDAENLSIMLVFVVE